MSRTFIHERCLLLNKLDGIKEIHYRTLRLQQMDFVEVIWLNILEITLLSMKWLALVNQLLHEQQHNLRGVLQRQPICITRPWHLKYRRLLCRSSETLRFGIKRHYSRQVKNELSTHFRGRLKYSPLMIVEN